MERRAAGSHRPGADRLDPRANHAERGPREGHGDGLAGNRQLGGPAGEGPVPDHRPRADGERDGGCRLEEGPESRPGGTDARPARPVVAQRPGRAAAYTLRAELQPADGGAAMDARTTRFGVRDVRWVHTEGAPADFISRYQLVINGRPVRTMGSNLIPPDLLFGRMGPRTLNLLRQAKAAGMNTLRLWGGGVILHDAAYDLADELGIMLVQEFPLANYLAADRPRVPRQSRNARCGTSSGKCGTIRPSSNSTAATKCLGVRRRSTRRCSCCRRSSPRTTGGCSGPHAPIWARRTALGISTSADVLPHYDDRATMRAGEFGTASPANLEVWHREIPPKDPMADRRREQPGPDPQEQSSGRCSRPTIGCGRTSWTTCSDRSTACPRWSQAGQFYGAEGCVTPWTRCGARASGIGGMTTWDFNEPWPNGAGSYLVDYDGRTLMNYDFFKQALAPISLSLQYDSVFYSLADGHQGGTVSHQRCAAGRRGPPLEMARPGPARDGFRPQRGDRLDRADGSEIAGQDRAETAGEDRLRARLHGTAPGGFRRKASGRASACLRAGQPAQPVCRTGQEPRGRLRR